MSSNFSQELRKRVESVEGYAKSNPYTVGGLITASVATLASGLAYWRLRAKEHPSTISVDLPMHHFMGHIPAVAEYVKMKTWHYQQIKLVTTKEANEAGVITLLMPNILYPYLHYIVDPDLIKLLFNDLNLPKGDSVTECFDEILGNTIFGSSGNAWQNHRKIANPMFSQHNLQGFMFNCSRDASQSTINKIRSLMIKDESGIETTTVDMFDILGRFTMDAIVEICFGKKCESMGTYPKEFEFCIAFDRAFNHATNRVRDPLWKMKRLFQFGDEPQLTKDVQLMYDFVDKMLDMEGRKKMIIDESGIEKHDIISLYLSKQPELTNDPELNESDLRFIALSFIVAGRDTTRNLLSWCLALLCTSQKEWLDKIMDEINGITSEDPSYQDINKNMKITECVLLETLRLYPSVVATNREIAEDITLPNGIKLFKGERIECNHLAQARNTAVYGEDATEFKPMRWYEKGLNTFPSHVFGAFHMEPRICLGRKFALTEAKVFLFYFLREFNFRSVGGIFPSFTTSVLLIMEDGWQVDITPK